MSAAVKLAELRTPERFPSGLPAGASLQLAAEGTGAQVSDSLSPAWFLSPRRAGTRLSPIRTSNAGMPCAPRAARIFIEFSCELCYRACNPTGVP
jgi:hypothetical protein